MKYLTTLLFLFALCLFLGACKHRKHSCCSAKAVMTAQPAGPADYDSAK